METNASSISEEISDPDSPHQWTNRHYFDRNDQIIMPDWPAIQAAVGFPRVILERDPEEVTEHFIPRRSTVSVEEESFDITVTPITPIKLKEKIKGKKKKILTAAQKAVNARGT
jgi:hypothetical protein